MKPHILILGSSGFIGGAVTAYLQRIHAGEIQSLSSRMLDLTEEEAWKQLAGFFREQTHLFVSVRPRRTPYCEFAFSTHMQMAATVARAVRAKKIAQCILVSSTSVYGEGAGETSVAEQAVCQPATIYGIAKLSEEQLIRFSAERARTPFLALRPAMLFGETAAADSYGPSRFLRAISSHAAVEIFGSGRERRNYLDIEDFAEIAARLLKTSATGVMNVAPSEHWSFRELAMQLEAASGGPITTVEVERARPAGSLILDTRRFQSAVPGFKFRPLSESLKRAYAAYAAEAARTQ
ncbi:MAG: hypothetical protein A2Z83_07620 [Omnitrophica bacterium GWA2_52_8]|nr:MAG: hypothetical protein A2Z83_07620 [Omnitrophica bacterium GWA2_52_8]